MNCITKQELLDFEEEIYNLDKQGLIKSPVHLRGGNIDALLEIFRNIREQDWICGTWAFHLECLLHNVPREKLKAKILEGRSISLWFPERNIISSAIVSGIVPVSVGLAKSIQLRGGSEKVYCFIGDSAFMCGISQESIRYAELHNLPVTFVVGDNGRSVSTPTCKVWNIDSIRDLVLSFKNTIYYKYTNIYPHSGSGPII